MSATVTCPLCDKGYEPQGQDLLLARCDCGGLIYQRGPGPSVVMAHESQDVAEHMGEALATAGFWPLRAANGVHVMTLLSRYSPAVVVIDVALEQVVAFQLIDYIRTNQSLAHTKVILVASVFRKTAYKRRPASLHGADDYLEQHHIPDMLADKVASLTGFDVAAARAARAAPAVAGQSLEKGTLRPDLTGLLRVRALAHSIVADIALYHQAEFEEAVRGDGKRLIPALEEGRRLLAEMVDLSNHTGWDPIGEAFNGFIAELRRASP